MEIGDVEEPDCNRQALLNSRPTDERAPRPNGGPQTMIAVRGAWGRAGAFNVSVRSRRLVGPHQCGRRSNGGIVEAPVSLCRCLEPRFSWSARTSRSRNSQARGLLAGVTCQPGGLAGAISENGGSLQGGTRRSPLRGRCRTRCGRFRWAVEFRDSEIARLVLRTREQVIDFDED